LSKKLEAWVDGSCPGNNSEKGTKGGWAVAIRYTDSDTPEIILAQRFLSGQEPDTTNNRMELTAVIECLKIIKYPIDIDIYTDSQYVAEGTQRMLFWSETGWRKTDGKPVKNQDLWQQIINLYTQLNSCPINFIWTRGHANDIMNNRVDKLAQEAARS